MKKVLEIMAFALVALPLIGGNVTVKYSGPSGQGDTIYKATATGVTNFALGTGGVYNATILSGELGGTAIATVVSGSALGTTAAQQASVWGPPGITTSTVGAVATAAIQTKNIAAGDLEDFRVIRVWVSGTSMGAASTNNITTLVLSGGTAVETKTAHADYIYLTATDGTASAAVTGEAAIDGYIMVEDGSSITAAKITFAP